MTRVVRKQTHKTRRLYGIILILFLLAAAGVGLYRYPPSLLDIGRIFRLAANKIPGESADLASAEPVLRGTIFDRGFRELAVSYPLYSLYIRPGEVTDQETVAESVAAATGTARASLEGRMKQAHNIIKVADNLTQDQVKEIMDKRLAGVYLKPVEERFYPAHEAAAGLIGYTGEGVGLAGVEGAYDMFLQRGEFRSESLPEIDFQGRSVIGRSTVDLVLTVDLALQKETEHSLAEYLQEKQADRGLAICLDVKTGAVLAWAGRPSYNPNYFWQLADTTGSGIFQEALDPALYRDLQVRAAALLKNGELGDPLPPATVAAVDYGLGAEEINALGKLIGLEEGLAPWQPVPETATTPAEPGQEGKNKISAPGVNALQFARAATSLVNGGWYVSPHVLAGVYAHEGGVLFSRSAAFDSDARHRVVSPAMGIRLRRDLFGGMVTKVDKNASIEQAGLQEARGMIIHSATSRRGTAAAAGGYVLQDLLLGVVPAKAPALLLLMVAQRDHLYPLTKTPTPGTDKQVPLAEKILPALLAAAQEQGRAVKAPARRDPANFTQFLISRRMDFQDQRGAASAMAEKMPEVTGLSLRKGLQKLNPYHLLVNIEGTGRIVLQNPAAGTPLHGVSECTLTLESKQQTRQ
ncbi:MAG: hypothetical protein ACYC9M_10045 [Desulfobulbaceae bacterium]